MAEEKVYCEACEELKKQSPNFIANGITDKECAYLQNDQGLSGKTNDCEDLNRINDCLIGSMSDEAAITDMCGWRDYVQYKLAPNLWTTFKALICTICGIWSNIWELWAHVEKLECVVGFLANGTSFAIGEETSGDAYAVAGKGVSFLAPGTSSHYSDLSLRYVAGGLMMGVGSYHFYNDDFTDSGVVGNFDKGSTYSESDKRKGNDNWGKEGRPANGGELICEFRIKKSTFPQIQKLYSGFGQETGAGAYHVSTSIFDGDNKPTDDDGKEIGPRYAYGQHGWCDPDGSPSSDGYDKGHAVPEGWLYVQLRLTYCFKMSANGNQYTPRYFMGVRMNQDEIPCE